jgi:hypothetical protein
MDNQSKTFKHPLTVELIADDGTNKLPLTFQVSQLVVRLHSGTPILLISELGVDNGYLFSKLGDKDFLDNLKEHGVDEKPALIFYKEKQNA